MGLCYHAERDLVTEDEKQMPAVPQPISPVRAATAPASHPRTLSQLAKQAERAQALHKAAQIIQSRGDDLPSPDQTSGMSRWHLFSCTCLPVQIESQNDCERHPCSDLLVLIADAVQEFSWAMQEASKP